MTVTSGELQLLAQNILQARNYELGDDPRTEIEVAQALGFLTIDDETRRAAGLPEFQTTEV
jgi:hypothetical protein